MQHEILTAHARALGREAHILARSPNLLWQQLHNRLQWEGDEVEAGLAPQRLRRSRPEATPWLRVATPFWESEALLRTLAGHSARVAACAFSPDGHRIASAGGRIVPDSGDTTLKIWDARTGALLHTLTGHSKIVKGCAFSPNGHRIVSASGDHTLKVWATADGSPVARVELPESLLSVACHPWLPQMACGDKTGALYRVALMGIGKGPSVVTARDRGPGLVVRCPLSVVQLVKEIIPWNGPGSAPTSPARPRAAE